MHAIEDPLSRAGTLAGIFSINKYQEIMLKILYLNLVIYYIYQYPIRRWMEYIELFRAINPL